MGQSSKEKPLEPAIPVPSDPDKFAENMLRLFEMGGKALSELIERGAGQAGQFNASGDAQEASNVFAEVTRHWMSSPERLAEAQGELIRGYSEIWAKALSNSLGQEGKPPVAPTAGDKRFSDPEWDTNPFFSFLKQAYLLSSNWAENLVEHTEGLDERTKRKADFYLRQIESALSPTNFPATNPTVIRETLSSNGENLVNGMANFLADLHRSGELFKITQTDTKAFEVGRNLAITPGKVIFQNDLIQLIQYAPVTDTVYSRPLLIVPPWINKFYILDLVPEKSFIKYVVEQGFTVFVISWANPDERLADKDFESYMREGILAAADAVSTISGADKINVLGYCVGGTLLATTLAYLAAKREEPFSSATFLTTQIDFTHSGDLGLFVDETQLKALKEMMAEHGYLDGTRMATAFNMLRPQDLIWPYIVNNYMLGKKPFPFDLLFWNQDSTRMTPANHSFYLKEFYLENKFAKGEMIIAGERLDPADVALPVYHLATKEDHIAPAKSVLIGACLFSGPVRFVLSGSGHIAGVVNPPSKHKYQYWTSDGRSCDIDEWLAAANEHPGSWWPDWIEWLSAFSGDQVPARRPGSTDAYPAIEEAPGSYVLVKS